jgi:signal transduction histidine kinase
MSDSQIGLEIADDCAGKGPTARACSRFEPSRAGIVHDLGNFIQVALSGLNHMARHPAFSNSPELEPVIAGARTALQSAGALVRETIGRERETHLRNPAADVGDCLTELRALLQPTWSPEIELTARVEADLPRAKCDRLGLQNAILNLLFNARDAMPAGGMISITATKQRENAAELIELRVDDEGVGMTPETVSRAFDPFFTTKGIGLGGVGLPMVRRFAIDNGGSIHIDSTFGSGTTVILRLLAADAV